MIKYHPEFGLIQSHVSGDLPASLSAALAIHADMCPKCRHQIAQLTEQMAEASFEESVYDRFVVDEKEMADNVEKLDFDGMLETITQSNDKFEPEPNVAKLVAFNNKSYVLPQVLSKIPLGKTVNIGKFSRTRVQLNENRIHTSLIQIEPGGRVPEHTHKGFEVTLLLDGSFNDENGEYAKGDFIMLDGSHQHNPVSVDGCLCYTVSNDALHFTQGINRLLNPIGKFIY